MADQDVAETKTGEVDFRMGVSQRQAGIEQDGGTLGFKLHTRAADFPGSTMNGENHALLLREVENNL